MTCATCHDPHSVRNADTANLAADCTQCHTLTDCGVSNRMDEARLLSQCVDCHMPEVAESGFTIETAGGFLLTRQLRDHYIRTIANPDEASTGEDAPGEQ